VLSQRNNRLHSRNPDSIKLAKPTAMSLLAHIVRATMLNGMQWPVFVSITLLSALHHYKLPHRDNLTSLVIPCHHVIGLARLQCLARVSQRLPAPLAMARHRQQDAGSAPRAVILVAIWRSRLHTVR
jgi:hypothetical protein